jgi:hypothetical protein
MATNASSRPRATWKTAEGIISLLIEAGLFMTCSQPQEFGRTFYEKTIWFRMKWIDPKRELNNNRQSPQNWWRKKLLEINSSKTRLWRQLWFWDHFGVAVRIVQLITRKTFWHPDLKAVLCGPRT